MLKTPIEKIPLIDIPFRRVAVVSAGPLHPPPKEGPAKIVTQIHKCYVKNMRCHRNLLSQYSSCSMVDLIEGKYISSKN